jgi:hypothetical protein
MTRYLYCVAHHRGEQWEAICLDFDLAVQGRTFEDVQARLQEAIGTYVEDALAQPEPSRSKLLHRRAPLTARLSWLWPLIVRTIFSRERDSDATVGFPVACRA